MKRSRAPILLGLGPISDSKGALVIDTSAFAIGKLDRNLCNFDELQDRLFATIKIVKRGAGSGDTDDSQS